MFSNSEIDLSRPLLSNDELASGDHRNEFEEDTTDDDSPNSARAILQYLWRQRSRRSLFCISAPLVATLLAILVVVLLSQPRSVTDVIVPEYDETLAYDARLEKYQTPATAQTCPDWSTPFPSPYNDFSSAHAQLVSNISFSLPSSTNLTFFVTRGRPVRGNFIIHTQRSTTDEISVDVIAEYDDSLDGREALNSAKGCLSGKEDDGSERGFLLWADPKSRQDMLDRVRFNISVHLPSNREFHEFSTDFTNSIVAHDVGEFFDLWAPTLFGRLRFNAKNAPMIVRTLITSEAYVSTSNAPFDGGFWVTESAHIQTSNAPIKGQVVAVAQEKAKEISASIRTENAPILAALAITSDFTHVKLNSSVHTSNGALQILCPRSSLVAYPSLFVLDASTSNSPASILLHNDFDGMFDLQTTRRIWGGGKAEIDLNVGRDPLGKNRIRNLVFDRQDKAYKAGKIFWGEVPVEESMGDVRLRTTGKDVTIRTQG
ncbi:hypothetical protein BC835DRAFT_633066 [Cytidiella melzeri]|nr:hypothetical protein BC835DRAFT_633066 [Cytidiella melzeri]